MLMIIGAISVFIWVIIFFLCFLFRDKKLPYLIYLLLAFLLAYFLWDSYNYDPDYYGTKTTFISILIGICAVLGLFMLLIGEITFEQLDNPWGSENSPKWPKYLAIFMVCMCIIVSMVYLI